MFEYQIERLLAWLIYSVALWMFSRYWHKTMLKKDKCPQIEDVIIPSVSVERLEVKRLTAENQQLMTESRKLKTENAQLKTELEKWKKIEKRESENLKAMKIQNDILFEALSKANKQRELEETDVEKPKITSDEFDAMVQVMKDNPIIPKNQKQAFKTQRIDLYNQLIDKIDGSKQRIEAALKDTEQSDYENTEVDLTNFDIRNYV